MPIAVINRSAASLFHPRVGFKFASSVAAESKEEESRFGGYL